MEWDFKSVLEDELVKLEWFYSFWYFNNVLTEEELNCISIKCKVGNKFKITELFKTEHYHTSYDEYDYSKYEE